MHACMLARALTPHHTHTHTGGLSLLRQEVLTAHHETSPSLLLWSGYTRAHPSPPPSLAPLPYLSRSLALSHKLRITSRPYTCSRTRTRYTSRSPSPPLPHSSLPLSLSPLPLSLPLSGNKTLGAQRSSVYRRRKSSQRSGASSYLERCPPAAPPCRNVPSVARGHQGRGRRPRGEEEKREARRER